MINAEFLGNCSDEQIDMGVAWVLAKGLNIDANKLIYSFSVNSYGRIQRNGTRFIPCLYESDIMPIQIANGIGLIFDEESLKPNWIAIAEKITGRHHEYYDIEVQNPNPLRAICEVYILMSVAK
jgi:hypothetical protein